MPSASDIGNIWHIIIMSNLQAYNYPDHEHLTCQSLVSKTRHYQKKNSKSTLNIVRTHRFVFCCDRCHPLIYWHQHIRWTPVYGMLCTIVALCTSTLWYCVNSILHTCWGYWYVSCFSVILLNHKLIKSLIFCHFTLISSDMFTPGQKV